VKIDPAKIQRVFVRAPNWLGDVIMATPSFARIRAFLIDAEIVCGMKRGHHAILSGTRSFDRLIAVDKPRGLGELWRQARLLRQHRFDLAILFPNSLSSALVCLLAGIRYRFGYVNGRRFLMTHGVRAQLLARKDRKRYGPRREPVPMPDYYGGMLDALGMPKIGPEPILAVSEPERQAASERLRSLGVVAGTRLLLLNPGASFGSSKLWAPERWARVADELSESVPGPVAVVVLVGPGEEALAKAIRAAASSDVKLAIDPVVPLDEMKAVVSAASLMVTTDSGPRHIAVAMRTPHVVLMGPTHPGYTARNLDDAVVLRHEVDCGPCHLKTCPLDHRCMTKIQPDEVVAASLAQLERGKR